VSVVRGDRAEAEERLRRADDEERRPPAGDPRSHRRSGDGINRLVWVSLVAAPPHCGRGLG
jgi:hypothetical protein